MPPKEHYVTTRAHICERLPMFASKSLEELRRIATGFGNDAAIAAIEALNIAYRHGSCYKEKLLLDKALEVNITRLDLQTSYQFGFILAHCGNEIAALDFFEHCLTIPPAAGFARPMNSATQYYCHDRLQSEAFDRLIVLTVTRSYCHHPGLHILNNIAKSIRPWRRIKEQWRPIQDMTITLENSDLVSDLKYPACYFVDQFYSRNYREPAYTKFMAWCQDPDAVAKAKPAPQPIIFMTAAPKPTLQSQQPANIEAIIAARVAQAVAIVETKFTTILNDLQRQMQDLLDTLYDPNQSSIEDANETREYLTRAFDMAKNANDRAAHAEEIAGTAVMTMHYLRGEFEITTENMFEKMNDQDRYIYTLMTKMNNLGAGFAILQAKVERLGEYDTICEALSNAGNTTALHFFKNFVAAMEQESIVNAVIKAKRFQYNYGHRGMIGDCLVSLASGVPIPGVGTAATIAQGVNKYLVDRKTQTHTRNALSHSGTIAETKTLAVRLAIIFLQKNGDIFTINNNAGFAIEVAAACKRAVTEFIQKHNTATNPLSVEEIGIALLSNYKKYMTTTSHKNTVTAFMSMANGEWLNEVLREAVADQQTICAFAGITLPDATTVPQPIIRSISTASSVSTNSWERDSGSTTESNSPTSAGNGNSLAHQALGVKLRSTGLRNTLR